MNLDGLRLAAERIRAEIRRSVLGQDEAIDLILTALFARGHCLIEGPPGLAKTLLARSVAAALRLGFGRIQFTPDLMPGDVLGANIFDFATSTFRLVRGPVFTDMLLADEINRAPPKTQAALLQAMQERVVTIDGRDHPLGPSFTVLATQNPIEHQGTYPLPEAQLDRFLFKIAIGFPDEATERAILARSAAAPVAGMVPEPGEGAVTAEEIGEAAALVDSIRLEPSLLDYLLALVRATRSDPDIEFGGSTRAAVALSAAVRAAAALDGRDYGLPDDVKRLFLPVFRHRIVLGPGAGLDGRSPDAVLTAILNRIEAPR